MLIAVDRGTTFTKSSEGVIFKSTVDECDELKTGLKVTFKDKKYTVGNSGRYETDLDKSLNENTELLVYSAIGKSFDTYNIDVDLIVGLPIGQYGEQKQTMKLLFDSMHNQITINNKVKSIRINRCEVFPEGAGAFYTQPSKDCLIVDIGGISIDNALFINGSLTKYSTYSMGVMKLYSQIANKINSKYDTNFMEWDIQKVLIDGFKIYGQRVEMDFDDIIVEYIKGIKERLSLEYDLKTCNVILTGGGAILLENYFKQIIPQSTRCGNEFSNVQGFKKIGGAIFK